MTKHYDARACKAIYTCDSAERRRVTLDAVGQITGIIDTDGTNVLQRMTFTNDAVGNRTGIEDSNGSRTTYQYDPKNRLTQDATTGTNAHTYDYTYDEVDNRKTSTETGVVSTFNYELAGRLTTSTNGSGITSYVYDQPGNLTNVQEPSQITTMGYDKDNRLTTHKLGAALTSYTYDGDGLKRTENDGTVTTLVWDGMNYLQGRA